MDRYSNFHISRKQAFSVAVAIIADIEQFCEEHAEDFEKFLQAENEKRKGAETQ